MESLQHTSQWVFHTYHGNKQQLRSTAAMPGSSLKEIVFWNNGFASKENPNLNLIRLGGVLVAYLDLTRDPRPYSLHIGTRHQYAFRIGRSAEFTRTLLSLTLKKV